MRTTAIPGRLMGTTAHLHLPDELIRPVTALLDRLESIWSRFLPASDISRLNSAGGHPVEVSSETIDLIRAMVGAHLTTDGAFDPTLLAPLVGLGYSASRHDASARTALPAGATAKGDLGGVLIDHTTRRVALPPGTILDAGESARVAPPTSLSNSPCARVPRARSSRSVATSGWRAALRGLTTGQSTCSPPTGPR